LAQNVPGLSYLSGAFGAAFPRLALAIALGLTLALVPMASRVHTTADPLAELPPTPEAAVFADVAARFGLLSTSIRVLEAPEGDLFTLERLSQLRAAHRAVAAVPGVLHVTGLTELKDATTAGEPGDERTVVTDLVGPLEPGSPLTAPEALSALKTYVLSLGHIRGALIDARGKTAVLAVQLDPAADLTALEGRLREAIAQAAPGLVAYALGAPTALAHAGEAGARIAPHLFIALALVPLLLVFVVLRDARAALIATLAALMPVGWLMGALGLAERTVGPFSGSAPLATATLGLVAALTVLLPYSATDAPTPAERARSAARQAAAPLGGLALSLLLLPIGVHLLGGEVTQALVPWLALGGMVTVVGTATLALAACVALRVPVAVTHRPAVQSRSTLPGLVGLAVAVLGGIAVGSQAEPAPGYGVRSTFAGGHPAAVDEAAYERAFGASNYLQVEVAGDIKHPHVLQAIERLHVAAQSIPCVVGVQSVMTPMLLGANALSGETRLPISERASRAVASMIDEDGSLRPLVTADWRHALVQIALAPGARVDCALPALDAAVARWTGGRAEVARAVATTAQRETLLDEVTAHARSTYAHGHAPTFEALRSATSAPLDGKSLDPVKLRAGLEASLVQNLVEDEWLRLVEGASLAPVVDAALAGALSTGIDRARLQGPLAAVVVEEERADAAAFDKVVGQVADALERIAATQRLDARLNRLLPLGKADESALRRALAVLEDPMFSTPDATSTAVRVQARVTGHPLVVEATHRRANATQWVSVAVIAAFATLLAVALRNLRSALLALVPCVAALAVSLSLRPLLGLPLDLSTILAVPVAGLLGLTVGLGGLSQRRSTTSTRHFAGPGVAGAIALVGAASLFAVPLLAVRNFALIVAVGFAIACLCALAVSTRANPESEPRP
jgi:hypothetical protein